MPRATKASQSVKLPEGFRYAPAFLSETEERDLLEHFKCLEFRSFNFQGYIAKRRILDYGVTYNFSTRQASPTKAIPQFLLPLRDNAAGWAGIRADEIVESVITEYPPGAPIGWHRDVPQFEIIIGVSLGSACRMRFKPYKQPGLIASIALERRSVYMMRGAVRWQYQHSIPPVKQLRYSITFRTLRTGRKPSSTRT
jgi:alkylated DNA repair dioxygenase AlkB